MTEDYLLTDDFMNRLDRAELYENPRVYLKAVIVTLYSLEFSEHFLYDEFKPAFLRYFGIYHY